MDALLLKLRRGLCSMASGELLEDGSIPHSSLSLSLIIDEIRSIGMGVGDINWSEIPRSNNRVADCLARNNFSLSCNFMFYDYAPQFIQSLLLEDKESYLTA